LLLENYNSLLQVFRRLFVLLFQFLELLLQIALLLGGCVCAQKYHNYNYCNPLRIESAKHGLTIRTLKPRPLAQQSLSKCTHFAVCPIALVNSSWA